MTSTVTNNLEHIVDDLYSALGYALKEIKKAPEPTPDEPSTGLTLAFGQHVITISGTVSEVYVSVVDDGAGVCGGANASTVGVSILDKCFVMYLDIKTDSATVKWVVQP